MTGIFPAQSSIDLHRQQFPALANKAYFNFGGQGTLPQASLDAISQTYQYIQHNGPFSTGVNAWLMEEGNATREAIASELGAPTSSITLTENVTVGCNIAMWGIDWQAGDHLLMTDCEHPGVIATAYELQRRYNIEVSTCPILATLNEGNPVEVIAEHLRSRTKLVVLSHLLWNTGQILPLADIVAACRNHPTADAPVRILADAAQSAGSLPLNLPELGVDFYAFTGHKWFCGPEGIGGLYVRPDALESLHPTFIGWRGITFGEKGEPTGWKPDGQRYEVATSAYPLYAGLRAAIATHSAWGTPQERYEQICKLSEYLWRKLSQLDQVHCLKTSPPEAGLVSFQLTNGKPHKQLVQSLEQKGFLLRTLVDPDCIRACVHYFTLPSEIDQLVEAVESMKDEV
ncbi:MAG: aminotransferase class V-fold PLP-dependent enzyme [Kastovskya adunca ATA6-11-RM4]|jgi:L-cysteine/cystine lyase|nr:aminotransferase class V-fold PLP-dependent enzyme [Kastovskya adunca ATA6-11-RM4]